MVYYVQKTKKIWYRRIIIERYFMAYGKMATMRKYQAAITRDIGLKVFEFAVLVGNYFLISREEVEQSWKTVMKVEPWEFTRNSLLFTRGLRK